MRKAASPAPATVREGRRTYRILMPCADGTPRRVLISQQGLTKAAHEANPERKSFSETPPNCSGSERAVNESARSA